jgi:hypothetical protein
LRRYAGRASNDYWVVVRFAMRLAIALSIGERDSLRKPNERGRGGAATSWDGKRGEVSRGSTDYRRAAET